MCNPNPTDLQRQCINAKIIEHNLGLEQNLIFFFREMQMKIKMCSDILASKFKKIDNTLYWQGCKERSTHKPC